MEHIVQFGITIDDEAITKTIVRQATENLQKELKDEISAELCGSNYNSWQYRNKLEDIAKEVTQDFFDTHKDEIISQAVDKLAEKLVKTKAVRQAVEDVMTKL